MKRLTGFTWQVCKLTRIFMFSGPVGLFHALKLQWLRRRIQRVNDLIEREKELHRQHRQLLSQELNDLIYAEQSTQFLAAQFWRYCEKQA